MSGIGNNGTQLDGKAWTLAMYGSYHPGERLFVDGLLGYQRLSYDLERFITANDGRVRGSRDGDQWFASQGYAVVRFTTGELCDAFDGCVEEIMRSLGLMDERSRTPTPSPSPQGGGGPGLR